MASSSPPAPAALPLPALDVVMTAVSGAAAQASWWTVATAAAYLYFLMPDVKPSFWIGVVVGCGGGLSALLTFLLPPWVQHWHQWTQINLSYLLQAVATVGIIVVCTRAGDHLTQDDQQLLLYEVCGIFFVASMASFRAQELLNGVLSTYGNQLYVQWFWIGGTACALFMGALQLTLRLVMSSATAGVAFLGVGAYISLLGIPAFLVLRKHSQEPEEEQPLLTNDADAAATAVPLQVSGQTLTAWDVLVVGRIPFFCAAMDFGYMMVRTCARTQGCTCHESSA